MGVGGQGQARKGWDAAGGNNGGMGGGGGDADKIFWWVGDTVRREVGGICSLLEPGWEALMAWPRGVAEL